MYSVEGEQHLLATYRHSSLCSTPFHPTPNILGQAGGWNLDAGRWTLDFEGGIYIYLYPQWRTRSLTVEGLEIPLLLVTTM